MLFDVAYKRRWKEKKRWYRTQGVLPYNEGGGENGTLIETSDTEEGGISAKQIGELIKEIID